LKGESRITDVTIINPYNEREFEHDKLSVVDVKAYNEGGTHYQIEIQRALHPGLASRILYTWSAIYHSLLKKGETYIQLEPVISI
jgi:predicted transposase/invertase (TIGR01784 family)